MPKLKEEPQCPPSPKAVKRFQLFGFIGFLLAFLCSQGVGFWIARALRLRIFDQPPFLPTFFPAHLIGALIGLFLLGCGIKLMMKIHEKERKAQFNFHHSRLTDALEQIAQGHFDVLIEPHGFDNHFELVGAINNMAQSLGNLETMRQDFISNVSHEIQSPLTSIGGFAALLQKDDLSQAERMHYAGIIQAESKRLSSLSDNLLKLSALDNSKPEKQPFRLDKQLERIALTLEPQWSAKEIQLEAELSPCTIEGDEELMNQVWVNLLHNAIKFTPPGGMIQIKLQDNTVSVRDTGGGIHPDDQIHIFERFYKADKARDRSLGGNGLGLSLVKKIVELHSGSVSVESEVGKGTVFRVVL